MGVCPGFPGRYSSSLSHQATTVVQLEDDVLAGELPFHQGCLRHAPPEDGRVDGECREGHRSYHGRQGLHLCRVQERETTSMLCAKTWREQKSRSGWLKSLKS